MSEPKQLPENAADERRALLATIEEQEAAVERAKADYKAAEIESEPFRKRMRAATDRGWEAKKRLAQARSDLTKILAFTAEDSMRPWVKSPFTEPTPDAHPASRESEQAAAGAVS